MESICDSLSVCRFQMQIWQGNIFTVYGSKSDEKKFASYMFPQILLFSK